MDIPSVISIDISDNVELFPLTCEFDTITWESLDYDPEGAPIGYLGKIWSSYCCLQIGSICSKLKVIGIKNVKKELMISAITANFKNKTAYELVKSNSVALEVVSNNPPRKKGQCSYRL
jgi:hypothetical protein